MQAGHATLNTLCDGPPSDPQTIKTQTHARHNKTKANQRQAGPFCRLSSLFLTNNQLQSLVYVGDRVNRWIFPYTTAQPPPQRVADRSDPASMRGFRVSEQRKPAPSSPLPPPPPASHKISPSEIAPSTKCSPARTAVELARTCPCRVFCGRGSRQLSAGRQKRAHSSGTKRRVRIHAQGGVWRGDGRSGTEKHVHTSRTSTKKRGERKNIVGT